MIADDHELRLRHFVEEIGLLFQEVGGSPMHGRVLGRLLVCSPPEQSLNELAAYLGASKSSISIATRQLLQAGIIVRVPAPGSRAAYFRLRDNAWVQVAQSRAAFTRIMREQAEKGLDLVRGDDSATARVQELVDFYRFFERAFPRLLDEWLASREKS